MKVLVLTHLDATNYSIANIVKELKKNGHYVEGYGRFLDWHNISMFEGVLEVQPLWKLTDEHIYEFDIIFCSLDIINRVRHIKKYIFCYNFLFCGTLMSDCGDFMFTQCDDRRMDYEEECATMAIGNPKEIVVADAVGQVSGKQILFIDSGHYPFGMEGRLILARLLLDICKKMPDYSLVIKPRFLPEDKNVTHRNSDHLYGVIAGCCQNELPDNLIMLQEHKDMGTLIEQSELVLCLYTTAYIDVALKGKRLIIIEGIPSDDVFDIRNGYHWKKQKAVLGESGCMVHYTEVPEHLPEGFICRESHLKDEVKYSNGAPQRAVRMMEFLWDKYLKNEQFPKLRRYDFDRYEEDIEIDSEVNWTYLIRKRYKNALRFTCRYVDYVDKRFAQERYMQFIDELEEKGLINVSTFNDLMRLINTYKNELWIKGKDMMMDDAINQSFLLTALYENHYCDELKQIKKEDVLCPSHYNYIMGRLAVDEKRYEEAIGYLTEFLAESYERGYSKYFSDKLDRQLSGEFHIALSYFELREFYKAYLQFQKCDKLADGNHRKAKEYMREIEKVWERERNRKRLEKLHFEVHLAEHCNLNCKSCSHFSPLAEEEFADIEELERDFKRLSVLTDGDVEFIELLGGEPLLYPDVAKAMDLARAYFPETKLLLLTNGLLLKRQNTDFWEACRRNRVEVVITKYPISADYEEMEKLTEENHVELSYRGNSDVEEKKFWHMHLNPEGTEIPQYSFSKCTWGNGCIALNHGKLYPCVMIAYIEHFNRFFGQELVVTENDYVDIYQVNDATEILDKLISVPDFCKYCKFDEGQRVYNTAFGISKKEITEWT